MGIGAGIFLLVIGGILAFGVKDSLDALDLTAIGYICMGAGALAIVLVLFMNQQRSNTSHSAVVEHRETGLPPEDPRRV
jgi:hypothetical protein